MNCRHCSELVEQKFVDLGFAPPSNAYLTAGELGNPEKYYPLRVKVCTNCWLVQTEDYAGADELFGEDYAYFSSTSSSWLEHAARYTEKIIGRLSLGQNSHIIEIASNDGYLLKNFVAADIPCLGIEPTDSTAHEAEKQGIPVLRRFFNEHLASQLAAEGKAADLIIGNNVYAHVPDINDFTRGLKAVLKPEGTITLEFPHLLQLIKCVQFDTIYHEHFSYLSLSTVNHIFATAGLRVWEIERLPTHGGSLRIYGCHHDDPRETQNIVDELLSEEIAEGIQGLAIYESFQAKADRIKDGLLTYLIEQKRAGRSVVAYGAAAKGNTLLNYAGVKPDLLPYICDNAISKQGKFMPGSHIPILPPSFLRENPPDDILILPWNIAAEVIDQNSDLAKLGTRFVTAVPELKIL